MVCEKCEKKLSKVACSDPNKWKDVASKASGSKTNPNKEDAHGRQLNQNKLLGKNKRYGELGGEYEHVLYMHHPHTHDGISTHSFAPYASGAKCKICKSSLHQEGIYCQKCAYSKGMCAMYVFVRDFGEGAFGLYPTRAPFTHTTHLTPHIHTTGVANKYWTHLPTSNPIDSTLWL